MDDKVQNDDLYERAEILGISHFLLCYTGFTYDTRAVLVPKSAIREAQSTGSGSHPANLFGVAGHTEGMALIPDAKTLIQLPWNTEIGWVMCDLYRHGEPFNLCPRRVLALQTKKARKKGFVLKTGVEIEFQLLSPDGSAVADPNDIYRKAFHEVESFMRKAPLVMKASKYMEQLGWKPYQLEREEPNGQFEFNFGYADAMTTADRHMFFKFMMKELAEAHGYRAVFMPVPLKTMTQGNGAHCNLSLWRTSDDSNVFPDQNRELSLSVTGEHFLGGLISHAAESAAIMCHTVNSYKRFNRANWAPRTVTYGVENKTVLIRIPSNGERLEHRMPDSVGNPYLVAATIIAAGMDGIEKQIALGLPCEDDATKVSADKPELPLNLLDALRALDASDFMRESLGTELVDNFVKLHKAEWDEYMLQVTDWEIETYLSY